MAKTITTAQTAVNISNCFLGKPLGFIMYKLYATIFKSDYKIRYCKMEVDMTDAIHLKQVIFDFDGTIANSYNYYLRILDEMYPHFNLDQRSEEEIEIQRTKSFKTIIQ